MDGGIRTGTDIFKALARGAKAVFVGRPVVHALTVNVSNNDGNKHSETNILDYYIAHSSNFNTENIDKINTHTHNRLEMEVILFSQAYFHGKANHLVFLCVWFEFHICKYNTIHLIFITIYGVVCVQLAHFSSRWLKRYIYSSCYHHHQIGSIHRSHCYNIFPWLCARDVCYIIFCHLLHIRSGKTRNLFSSLLCSLWWVQIFGLVLACRSYSFVCTAHHLIIIIVQTYLNNWTYKMPVRFVECVSKIKHILFVIYYTICGAVCFQFTHFCCDDWENIYTLSYYHHQIGSMNYYPLFRVRSWNNGVRCMPFYILSIIWDNPCSQNIEFHIMKGVIYIVTLANTTTQILNLTSVYSNSLWNIKSMQFVTSHSLL